MAGTVTKIFRYPVKGLSEDSLEEVSIETGKSIPHDRRFAMLATGSTPFDRSSNWQSKSNFVSLFRYERLAELETRYEETKEELTILRAGKPLVRGQLNNRIGRSIIEEFFAAYLGSKLLNQPSIVFASETAHTLSDYDSPVISIVNQKSIRDIERVVGCPINPLRFRANLLVDLDEPWCEFSWVGCKLSIGSTKFFVESRIERCAATNVNPETGERDLNLPKSLKANYGHIDCGVYAHILSNGKIRVGDSITEN